MNIKRMRGRNNRGGGQGGGGGGGGSVIRHHSTGANIPMNRNHVFDSSGPDLRIRGTAQQLFEKYLQLGRDASGSGDRVMAESYFQHAEHYFRILNAMQQAQQQQAQSQASQPGGPPNSYQGNGHQPRRFSNEAGHERGDADQNNDQVEDDGQLNGSSDQPLLEGRDIPISPVPPEG